MKERAQVKDFLRPGQWVALREIGKQCDKWRRLLEECGGNIWLAVLLSYLREINSLPESERPRLTGPSERVASQQMANRRGY